MKKAKIKDLSGKIGIGLVIGIINGLFGAGGGMIAVPLLKNKGLDQKNAHRNAVAVVLPISILSAFLYVYKGYVKPTSSLIYIPTGVLGAFLGIKILDKISPKILKAVFGGFMVYAGIRLLFR